MTPEHLPAKLCLEVRAELRIGETVSEVPPVPGNRLAAAGVVLRAATVLIAPFGRSVDQDKPTETGGLRVDNSGSQNV